MNDPNSQYDKLPPRQPAELPPYPTSEEPIHFYAEPEVDPLRATASSVWLRLRAWFRQYYKGIVGVVGSLIIIVTAVLLFTDGKYAVMNLFGRTELTVTVIDAATKQPIPGVALATEQAWARTDDTGKAIVKQVPYGSLTVSANKAGYAASFQPIKITRTDENLAVSLTSNGELIRFRVSDLIGGKPLQGVKATFRESDAISDSEGFISLSLPRQSEGKAAVTLAAKGMTSVTKTFSTLLPDTYPVGLVPAGKIYFLSKASGRLDVVKSNLDGTARQTVVMGSGKEDDQQTVLVASPDWKYLALKSKRDGAEKVFIIDTHNDSMRVIDEERAAFNLAGWSGHHFVYSVERVGATKWQSKSAAIKGFNANSGMLTVIDENAGRGTNDVFWLQQVLVGPYLVDGGVTYAKYWAGTMARNEEQHEIIAVNADGSQKRVVKALRAGEGETMSARRLANRAVFFEMAGRSGSSYYSLQNGKASEARLTRSEFLTPYPVRLLSPDGNSSLWHEVRSGKAEVSLGDKNGENGKRIAGVDGYTAYGWFTNNYALISSDKNELFIISRDGPPATGALKISDYHKATYTHQGFGYGGF